jgi:hypothetical protein
MTRKEWVVVIAGAVVAAGAVFVAKQYSLWILVPIPSAVALVYHLLNLESRFDDRKAVVDQYMRFSDEFDKKWSGTDAPIKVSEDISSNLERHRPNLPQMLWGAALLTAIFAIPGVISNGGQALEPPARTLGDVSTALSSAQTATSIDAVKKSVTAAQDDLKIARKGGLPEWQRGLVFAGFGVWLLIVLRMIGRINAGGLNARFLITASLRAAGAMMFGFFAGATDILSVMTVSSGTSTYFLIGMFYPVFFEQLKDFAYTKLFKQDKTITTEMPTTWVDGVDDDTADILTEVNVLSVEHLATADPGILTVRSLIPFTRVVDMIDQAILISYFREKIVELRKIGIRGVMDFVAAMEPVVRNTKSRAEAEKAIAAMVRAVGLSSPEELITVGMSMYGDYRVNLLMRLWQHNVQPEGFIVLHAATPMPAPVPLDPERLPIRVGVVPSYRLIADSVKTQMDFELRGEAAQRAARFREQNPDDTKPAADWLDTSFSEAYAAALQRATIGANPHASAQMRSVYEEAFNKALD